VVRERLAKASAEGVTPVIAQDPEPYRASNSGETGTDRRRRGMGLQDAAQNSQAKGQRGTPRIRARPSPIGPDLP